MGLGMKINVVPIPLSYKSKINAKITMIRNCQKILKKPNPLNMDPNLKNLILIKISV